MVITTNKSRRMVKGADLNGAGNLFGGTALAWIDEDAAIFAFSSLGNPPNIVTKAISGIDFRAPGKLGDIIDITCNLVSIGNTSITMSVEMVNTRTDKLILFIESMTFVSVDGNGEKAPHGVTPGKVVEKSFIAHEVL